MANNLSNRKLKVSYEGNLDKKQRRIVLLSLGASLNDTRICKNDG
ncbi:hypothetical protein SAMN05216302_10694 [Nitrosomonas aestuarii]|uniref:Uncharacterized protein n=1 Tax=Nitrosomonas aestuarii TaxID=52441 RepID=A0A1I4H339_9PROT|nr:hypothetical protein SAMN05216302_10694 [Nitrosomonas aestuarii]